MVRSKSMYNDCNPNPNLEGVQCDFSKRYVCMYVWSASRLPRAEAPLFYVSVCLCVHRPMTGFVSS